MAEVGGIIRVWIQIPIYSHFKFHIRVDKLSNDNVIIM